MTPQVGSLIPSPGLQISQRLRALPTHTHEAREPLALAVRRVGVPAWAVGGGHEGRRWGRADLQVPVGAWLGRGWDQLRDRGVWSLEFGASRHHSPHQAQMGHFMELYESLGQSPNPSLPPTPPSLCFLSSGLFFLAQRILVNQLKQGHLLSNLMLLIALKFMYSSTNGQVEPTPRWEMHEPLISIYLHARPLLSLPWV